MLGKIFKFTILFIFMSTYISGVYAQNSISRKSTPLPFTVYKTNENTLSIQDIIDDEIEFINPENYLKKTHPSDVYWVKIDFKNELNKLEKDSLWFLKIRTFEYLSVFILEDNIIKEAKFGRFENTTKNRSLIYAPGIPFKQEQLINNRYLYLKLKRAVYFDNITNWRFGYNSLEKEHLIRYYYSSTNLKTLIPYYLFSGICLIMFFLTLAFYIYSKRIEFLFYMLYVLFLFLYLTSEVLNLHHVFFGTYNLASYSFFQVSQIIINLCYILFIIHYLNTVHNYKKLHVALKSIAVILGVIIVLDTVFFACKYFIGHIYIMDFERIVMTLFGLIGMIYLLIKGKNKLAYFVVFGSFFYMIGALGLLFLGNGVYMIIGSILEILIFASGLTYKIQGEYNDKIRFQEEAIKNKSKALRAQINPHFIFNSLSSIQHLITGNNKPAALKYLTKFSRLTRNILESSIESSSVLSNEISTLKDYLELESLRFDESFIYSIEVDPNVEIDIIEVPILIIQPFVENAIIHGLLGKEGNDKKLTIQFKQDETYLKCIVDDNGIGREASSNKRALHKNKSRGLEVTNERLKMINESDNNVQIIDKVGPKNQPLGTTVIIKIKL